MRLVGRTLEQIESPITRAEALAAAATEGRAVLDLSQGAPSYPPADAVIERMIQVAREPDGHRYTVRPGLPELRRAFAEELSRTYEGEVQESQILITAGCNQAFCVVMAALTDLGDEVLLPVPYYFNHDMWLRLDRAVPIHVLVDDGYVPSLEAAKRSITARTRALVLVTPSNPTGVTISPALIGNFAEFAAANDLALVIDETYRSFRGTDDPPHNLFQSSDWSDSVVSLHSFSKDFAIPGCRVGAVVADERLLVEVMKLFSCVAICAPRLGQEAVLAGLAEAQDWRAQRAAEIREKQASFSFVMASQPGGFVLCSAGAYFGWVRHPFPGRSSDEVVEELAMAHGVHVLPGTAFMPTDEGFLRFSIANLTHSEIDELGTRLAGVE